jgi:hypothetical protein
MFTFLFWGLQPLRKARFTAAAFEMKFIQTSLLCWCLHHLLAHDTPPTFGYLQRNY